MEVNPRGLVGFGKEYSNYTFKDGWDWMFHVRDPWEVIKAQPTYFLSEWSFVIIGFVTLIHAFIVGGRWKYHWLGCYLHGCTTELMSFWLPDIDNYWHSQTTVMMLGRRLPFHIPLIYPSFMYIAAYAVAHARLPRRAEPLAAGLIEVLVDIPYDIAAVKFVHWTWHDTDPNILDRHYWVPWNSYYFHLTFGAAFSAALHFWRRKLTGTDDKDKVFSVGKEVACAALAGLCGMPGGVLQFLALYHPLHDGLGIHTENCVFTIVVLYFLIVWAADRSPGLTTRRQKVFSGEGSHWSVFLLVGSLVMHYGLYLGMVVFGHPDKEVSIGLHQTVGPCDQTSVVYTATGGELQRNTYLCSDNYDEGYFDFHCLPSSRAPLDGSEWYTICGTPFPNRAEYIATLSLVCIVAAAVFYQLLFRSCRTLVYYPSGGQKAKSKVKTKRS